MPGGAAISAPRSGPSGEAEGGYPAAFAPDGRSIVFFRAPDLILAEADTGKEIRQFGHVGSIQDAVWAIAFSPDGKTLAALHDDEIVRLWDPATGKETAADPRRRRDGPGVRPGRQDAGPRRGG